MEKMFVESQQQLLIGAAPFPDTTPRDLLDPAYAHFRDQTRFWIQRVAVPLILLVGLFGNLVTMIIMTRRRMRSTTNLYLAALALVDMLYLVLVFLLGLSHYPNMAARKYVLYWRLKPFLMMLTDSCSNTSVWLTVSFTIERYIAVKYPIKGKVWCTEERAKRLIGLVMLFGLLCASPVPFEWRLIERRVDSDRTLANIISSNNESLGFSVREPTSQTDDKVDNNGSNDNDFRGLFSNMDEQAETNVTADNETTFYGDINDVHDDKDDATTTTSNNNHNNDDDDDDDAYLLALDNTEFGKNETYKTIYYWSTAAIFYFIPLISLTFFNGFLIKSVHQSHRERKKMTNVSQSALSQYNQSNGTSSNQSQTIYPKGDDQAKRKNPRKRTHKQQTSVGSSESSLTTAKENVHQSSESLGGEKKLIIQQQSKQKQCNHLAVPKMLRSRVSSADQPNVPSDPMEFLIQVPMPKRSTWPSNDLLASMQLRRSYSSQFGSKPNEFGRKRPRPQSMRRSISNFCPNAPSEEPALSRVLNEPVELDGSASGKVQLRWPGAYANDYVVSLNHAGEICDRDARPIDVSSSPQTDKMSICKSENMVADRAQQWAQMSPETVVIPAHSTGSIRTSKPAQTPDAGSKSVSTSSLLIRCENDLAPTRKATTFHESASGSNVSHSSYGATAAAASSICQVAAQSTHQERRITIMLIAVVILFLVCQIPTAAMLIYTSVNEPKPNSNESALVLAFGNIFNFLMAVNAAGNFILYSLLSRKYRRTFVILFCDCFRRSKKGRAHVPAPITRGSRRLGTENLAVQEAAKGRSIV